MRVLVLGNEVSGIGATPYTKVLEAGNGRKGTFVTLLGGNQAGILQGSINGGTTWTTITNFTANSPKAIDVVLQPLMRVTITASTTGKSTFLLHV